MLNIHAKMFFLAAGVPDLSAQSRPEHGQSQPRLRDTPADERVRFVAPRDMIRAAG